jgi:hypothetical protein
MKSMAQKAGGSEFTVVLAEKLLTGMAVLPTDAGIAREVTMLVGDAAVSLPASGAATLSIPYTASSTASSIAVMMESGASGFAPLPSSRYDDTTKTLSARIDGSGVFVPAINPVAFTDVNSAHWANVYITDLSARKVIEGMGDGLFSPDSTLTRAQLIKLLVNALGLYDDKATCAITDVPFTSWYYPYVASAVKAGILSDGGIFNPDGGITREDMCVYSYLSAAPGGFTFPTAGVAGTFTDEATISPTAVTAVKTLKNAGIITGYPDGTIKPKGTLTRAEASKIIYLILSLQK